MFFDDEDLGELKKRAALRVPPPIPETNWLPPQTFPNLSEAVVISIDTETKETDFEHGPGWARGKGHIIGFSLAAKDANGNCGKWYFPVRHELEPEYNLDPATCFAWLKTQLETPHIPKVGANLLYDIGWLTSENIFVQGELHDVQYAEALLHEEGQVALDFLGQKYVGSGKESDLIYQWLAEAYGGSANGTQRANFYRTSPRLIGLYGETDADLPLKIIEKQFPLMAAENLCNVYRMECDSIYLLTQMRLEGVTIDIPAAEQLYAELALDLTRLNDLLYKETGVHANVDSSRDLAKVFDAAGIIYPQTAKGSPSFTKEFLKTVEHPIADIIRDIREVAKVRSTFVRAYLLERNINGKVHASFHPLRNDEGGTRSGRFASSQPNFQNIPVRSDLGKRVRKLFIPDAGHIGWEKYDYSQIEYRCLMHFAVGPGADEGRKRYNSDPKTDYHVMTQELVKAITGIHIDRKPIKNINFGLLYGMGEPKLARQIGIDKATAKEIFKAYHTGNPYVKATMQAASDEVHAQGYIQTILNRRSRFDLWEPRQINYEQRAYALPYKTAIENYGVDIIRANTHKAINRKLQGSAADIIKDAMIRCFKEGVFAVTGVPKLQVHDELDFSVIDDSRQQREAYAHMRYLLENSLKLKVPVLVEFGRGENWGSIKD